MKKLFVAVFDGCPNRNKKIGSPAGEATHSSVKEWGDCAVKCESTLGCEYWHWDSSSETCSTMTGDGIYVDDSNFVAGKKGCTASSNITAWTTCSDVDPASLITQSNKKLSVSDL